MSKNSSPPPPDYAGAAEATAAGDLANARYQTLANRPDSYYPGGSRTWEQGYSDPVIDQAGYDQALAAYNQANPSASTQVNPAASGYTPGAWPGMESPQAQVNPAASAYTGDSSLYGPNNGPMDSGALINNQYLPRPTEGASTGGQQAAPGGAPNIDDYTTPGSPDKWTERVELSPEGQKAFDINERNTTQMAGLGTRALDQAGNILDTPFSIEGQTPQYQGATGNMPQFQGPEGQLGQYGQHRQGVVDAMMSRVNTDTERQKEQQRSRLVAQGIPVGSEAFNREMEQSDRKQTDARQQAEIAAEQMAGMGYASDIAGRQQMGKEGMDRFGTGMDTRNQYNQEGMTDFTTGMDTRRQGIQEALLQRQTPLNEISALRSGSQVGMPQFQPFGQQSFTGGPDYAGAASQTGQYNLGQSNQGIAQGNALAGGLFGLGAAGIGAYPWSDRRLKTNIKRHGTSLMGFPVYAFDYIWGGGRQVGVMAQDVIKVMPEAVKTVDGYMQVDYGMIR